MMAIQAIFEFYLVPSFRIFTKTRPNQVRTLTVIKSLYQNFKDIKILGTSYLNIKLWFANVQMNHIFQKLIVNEQNVQILVNMNKDVQKATNHP